MVGGCWIVGSPPSSESHATWQTSHTAPTEAKQDVEGLGFDKSQVAPLGLAGRLDQVTRMCDEMGLAYKGVRTRFLEITDQRRPSSTALIRDLMSDTPYRLQESAPYALTSATGHANVIRFDEAPCSDWGCNRRCRRSTSGGLPGGDRFRYNFATRQPYSVTPKSREDSWMGSSQSRSIRESIDKSSRLALQQTQCFPRWFDRSSKALLMLDADALQFFSPLTLEEFTESCQSFLD